MPSSDPITIPKVLSIVERIRPRSILDVGCGNGRYGVLFRELLDWNHGRLDPSAWWMHMDGVEIDESYLNPIHFYVYQRILKGNFLEVSFDRQYDLVFMGDVLEHFTEAQWRTAQAKARILGHVTLISCPNHRGSLAQGEWHGHEHERHHVLLSPELVGGRCLYASSKAFICGFDNRNIGILDHKDVCP